MPGARTIRTSLEPPPPLDDETPAIVSLPPKPIQKALSWLDRLAGMPGAIVATWATAFAFIAILIGGALWNRITVERHLGREVAAMAQLAAEKAGTLLDQARFSTEPPGLLQAAFARSFNEGFIPGGDAILLYDLSGRLLASWPANPSAVGLVAVRATALDRGPSPPPDTMEDGTHLIGVTRLARHPFVVAYARNIDAQQAAWRYQQIILAFASIAALAVTALLSRGIARRLALTRQLEKMRDELEMTNGALRAALTATELIAAKDQLTGLWNRRTFDHRLEEAIAHATRHSRVFSLLIIDIDHFKRINDQYGHIVGDEVLRRFAEALRERLRQNDVAARWGGEEFVILADETTLENACQLGEQIRAEIAATVFPHFMQVTASIGLTAFEAGDDSDTLLNRADRALYAAKRNGRDRVVAADAADEDRVFFCDPSRGEPSLF